MHKALSVLKRLATELKETFTLGPEPSEITRLIQCGDLFRNTLMKQININQIWPLELMSVTWFSDIASSIDTPKDISRKITEWLESQEEYAPRLALNVKVKKVTNEQTLSLGETEESFDNYAKVFGGVRDYKAEAIVNTEDPYVRYIVYKFPKEKEIEQLEQ